MLRARTGRFAFRAFGVNVGIAGDPAIVEAVAGLLPPGAVRVPLSRARHWLSVENTAAGWRVRGGPMDLPAVPTRGLAVEALEGEMRLHVAAFARRRIFVHAGVVGWQGRAIVLPGRSMHGKSTLVRALLERGASYLSDEYAVVDERGLVHPYARGLALRSGGPSATLHDPRAFGRIASAPLPVGLVVLTRFEEGGRFAPSRLSPAALLLGVLEHTIPVRRAPRRSIRTLGRALDGAVGLDGARGEAGPAAERILAQAPPAGDGE